MLLKSLCEFRGISSNISQNGNSYHFINLEDDHGESYKFRLKIDPNLASSTFKKGQKYVFLIDLDPKYNSLQVVDFEVK